jgi:hypothetical protein
LVPSLISGELHPQFAFLLRWPNAVRLRGSTVERTLQKIAGQKRIEVAARVPLIQDTRIPPCNQL